MITLETGRTRHPSLALTVFLSLTFLALVYVAWTADSPESSRTVIAISCVYAAIVAARFPVISTVAFLTIFVFATWYGELRSVVPILPAPIVVSFLAFHRGSRPATVATLALAYVASIEPSENDYLPAITSGSIIVAALLSAGLISGTLWRNRASALAQQSEKARKLRAEEHNRLMHRLHDNVAHPLTATILRLERLSSSSPINPEHTNELRAASNDAREAMAELRAMLDFLKSGDEGPGAHLDHSTQEGDSLTFGELNNHFITQLRDSGFDIIMEPSNIYASLDRTHLINPTIYSSVMNEIFINLIKYSDPSEPIRMQAEVGDPGEGTHRKEISLIIFSKIADKFIDGELSSGISLEKVHKVATIHNFDFASHQVKDTWVTAVSIALSQEDISPRN